MQKNNINDEHIKIYAKAMGEVNVRINSVESLYEHVKILPKIPEPIIIESAALQIRKVLELIAFALLVANKGIYSKKIEDEWHTGDIIKQMGIKNPNFYPVPLVCDKTSQALTERTNNYLTKDEFTEVYGKYGDILHRLNPLKVKGLLSDQYYQKQADFIHDSSENIKNLLDMHTIQLVNEGIVWVICMDWNSNGMPSYRAFEPSEK